MTSVDRLSRKCAVHPDEAYDDDDDVRTMFSIFGQFNTREPIELDSSLIRSVEHIQQSLISPRNYEEIRALMNAPDEEISLNDM